MAFVGLRTTDSWVTDQRPKDFMQMLFLLYPNGVMDLTNLTTLAGSSKTTDPEFNHWEKTLAKRRGTITGIYTNAALSSAYVSGGVEGDVIYVQLSQADSTHFVKGAVVKLRLSTNHYLDTVGYVLDVKRNGAGSYLAVELNEADDNGGSVYLASADTVLLVGTAHEEGANRPEAVSYDATKKTNYTEIFRRSLKITQTMAATKLRTDPQAYPEMKREMYEHYGMDTEMALIHGVKRETTGPDGEPLRFTQGLISATKEFADSNNVSDFTLDTEFSGSTWRDGGKKWLDKRLMYIFRYGNVSDKLCVVGDGALLGIQEIVEANSQMNITSGQTDFGMDVMKWITPFGTLNMKTHPLFSHEETDQNTMLIYEPKRVTQRTLRPTRFYPDPTREQFIAGETGKDKIEEELKGEFGFQFKHPEVFGYLTGVGKPSQV